MNQPWLRVSAALDAEVARLLAAGRADEVRRAADVSVGPWRNAHRAQECVRAAVGAVGAAAERLSPGSAPTAFASEHMGGHGRAFLFVRPTEEEALAALREAVPRTQRKPLARMLADRLGRLDELLRRENASRTAGPLLQEPLALPGAPTAAGLGALLEELLRAEAEGRRRAGRRQSALEERTAEALALLEREGCDDALVAEAWGLGQARRVHRS